MTLFAPIALMGPDDREEYDRTLPTTYRSLAGSYTENTDQEES